jgi:hypothetical protein
VNVIASDFDEFLYCAPGSSSAGGQRAYLKEFIYRHKNKLGYEQISIRGRYLMNTTQSTKLCVAESAARGQSIFRCFMGYRNHIRDNFIKAIHLSHRCPLTSYHEACRSDTPRVYDCLCKTTIYDRECRFLHLTLNDVTYAEWRKWRRSGVLNSGIVGTSMELWSVLNSTVYTKKT